MQFKGSDIPDDLSYTKNHLWVKWQDNLCTLGWTDYIQMNAGDVNYVELSKKGTPVQVNQDFGSIETSKWVDRLYSPIEGVVAEVNDQVIDHPELVNKAPFAEGWLVKLQPRGASGSKEIISAKEYLEYIRACEERG